MKIFIKEHEDDDANSALRSLTAKIKKEYSNLRRTGKGSGKFAGAFPDGSQYLDVFRVYADDNGSFRGRFFDEASDGQDNTLGSRNLLFLALLIR